MMERANDLESQKEAYNRMTLLNYIAGIYDMSVGRICMDQCMVDVTDLPVTVGTSVTLFGETSAQLESLADRAHTIPYELLCLITARIPRVWGNDSKKERP